METKVTPQDREKIYSDAVKNGALLGGGLPFPVGQYELQILNFDDAFSERVIEVTREGKKEEKKLLLVKGQITVAEKITTDNKTFHKGMILDKGHRSIAVDNGELWKSMRDKVIYSFEVTTYDKKIVDVETKEEKTVPRKITANFREVSEIEQ